MNTFGRIFLDTKEKEVRFTIFKDEGDDSYKANGYEAKIVKTAGKYLVLTVMDTGSGELYSTDPISKDDAIYDEPFITIPNVLDKSRELTVTVFPYKKRYFWNIQW